MKKCVLIASLLGGVSVLGAAEADSLSYGGGILGGAQAVVFDLSSSTKTAAKKVRHKATQKSGAFGGQVQGFFDIGYVLSSMTHLGVFLQGGMGFGKSTDVSAPLKDLASDDKNGQRTLTMQQKTSFGGGLMVGQHMGNVFAFLGGGALLTKVEVDGSIDRGNNKAWTGNAKKNLVGIHVKLGLDVALVDNFSVGLQAEGTFYGKLETKLIDPANKNQYHLVETKPSSLGASVRFKFHN